MTYLMMITHPVRWLILKDRPRATYELCEEDPGKMDHVIAAVHTGEYKSIGIRTTPQASAWQWIWR